MKKIIIISIGIFFVGLLLSPVLGMAIGPTRELILGMAPEEAILELADKIDENKIDSVKKDQDLEAIINSQQIKISEQEVQLIEQQQQLNLQEESVNSVEIGLENQSQCSMLYGKNPQCQWTEYSSQEGFNEMIKQKFKHPEDDEEAKEIKRRESIYSDCKEINTQCN